MLKKEKKKRKSTQIKLNKQPLPYMYLTKSLQNNLNCPIFSGNSNHCVAPHNRVFLLCFQHVLDTICMTCTPVELFEFLLSVLRPAPHALYHSHLTSNQHLQLAALGLHYSKEPPPTPRRQLIPRQHAAVGNVAIPSNKDTGIIAMTHSLTAHSVPPSSRHHGRD